MGLRARPGRTGRGGAGAESRRAAALAEALSCGVARAGARLTAGFAAGFGAALAFAAGFAARFGAGFAAAFATGLAATRGAFAFSGTVLRDGAGFALAVPGLLVPVLVVPALAGARRGFGASSDALGVRAMAASYRFLRLT